MANLKEISQITGFSPRHISRVLKGEDHVDGKSAEYITKVSMELGYSPNLSARSLKSRKSYDILALCWDTNEPLVAKLEGVIDANRGSDYSIIIEISPENSSSERTSKDYIVNIVRKRKPAGIILIPRQQVAIGALAELLSSENIAHVIVDSVENELNTVSVDRAQGIHQGTKHLMDSGCKRVAYSGASAEKPWDRGRFAGYLKAISAFNAPPLFIEVDCEGDRDLFESGKDAAEIFIKMKAPPDGIQFFSDRLALGFINRVRKHGIEIPGEVAVSGFDDIGAAEICCPSLTTLAQPNHEIGRIAYMAILEKINGQCVGANPKNIKIAPLLQVRQSTQKDK